MKAEEAKYETRIAIEQNYEEVFSAIRKAASMGYTELQLTDEQYTYEHKLCKGLQLMGYHIVIIDNQMTVIWR